jgi:hypothetical protein
MGLPFCAPLGGIKHWVQIRGEDFVVVPGGDDFIPLDRPDQFLAEFVARVRPCADPRGAGSDDRSK